MPRQKNRVILDVIDPKSVQEAIHFYSERRKLVLASQKEVAEQTAIGIRNTHIPQLLAILRVYPPRRPGMKIRWTSPAQKRAYFATNGFGGGIPYKRTGRLAAGWKSIVSVKVVGKQVKLVVKTWNDALSPWNGKPYAQFVVGAIGLGTSKLSQQRYLRPQQQFHRDRGWHPAYQDIAFFYQRMRDYAADNYRRYYSNL